MGNNFEQLYDEIKQANELSQNSADRQINEQADDDIYKTKADVLLSVKDVDADVEAPKEISVTYRIEIEHRSWGINGINVNITEPIEFEYELVYFDNNGDEINRETKRLKIEPDKIKYLYQAGQVITIDIIEIRVDKEGKVLDCDVSVYYMRPD